MCTCGLKAKVPRTLYSWRSSDKALGAPQEEVRTGGARRSEPGPAWAPLPTSPAPKAELGTSGLPGDSTRLTLPGCERRPCTAPGVSASPIGGVEKEKVVSGGEVVGLQVWTLLSMVPLAPQWAEMQPPVPSVVW